MSEVDNGKIHSWFAKLFENYLKFHDSMLWNIGEAVLGILVIELGPNDIIQVVGGLGLIDAIIGTTASSVMSDSNNVVK